MLLSKIVKDALEIFLKMCYTMCVDLWKLNSMTTILSMFNIKGDTIMILCFSTLVKMLFYVPSKVLIKKFFVQGCCHQSISDMDMNLK